MKVLHEIPKHLRGKYVARINNLASLFVDLVLGVIIGLAVTIIIAAVIVFAWFGAQVADGDARDDVPEPGPQFTFRAPPSPFRVSL